MPGSAALVVCAVAAYDGIRMSDWHLAQHLSELAPVLYVDPPSFRHPAVRGPRRAGLRLRQEAPGLARLIPAALNPRSSGHTRSVADLAVTGLALRGAPRLRLADPHQDSCPARLSCPGEPRI